MKSSEGHSNKATTGVKSVVPRFLIEYFHTEVGGDYFSVARFTTKWRLLSPSQFPLNPIGPRRSGNCGRTGFGIAKNLTPIQSLIRNYMCSWTMALSRKMMIQKAGDVD